MIEELISDFEKLEDRKHKKVYAKAISKHYIDLAKKYKEYGNIDLYTQCLAKSLKYRIF